MQSKLQAHTVMNIVEKPGPIRFGCLVPAQILSTNTRRTKVVELSSGTHRYSH
jgi:hypothetical protein